MSENQENEIVEKAKELSIGEQNSGENDEIEKDTVDDEEKAEVHEAELGEDDDEDDEFGAFSDASFDEFEQPPEPESPKQEEPEVQSQSTKSNYKQLPQSLFDEPEMFQMQINDLLNQSYPEELQPSSIPPNTDVLNERSSLLLERLVALPYLKPYSWKKSSLRRQLLQTLGIDDSEQGKIRRRNLDDGSKYVIPKFEGLGISEEEANKYKQDTDELLSNIQGLIKEDEELQNLNDEDLGQTVAEYIEKIAELEKLLSIWEYEQQNLENDNKTFEGVVENLVGHTQRLRREETMKSLKKEAQKSKGLGSIFKKKSKN